MREIEQLPRVMIQVNQQWLPALALAGLVEIRVQQRLSLPTQCELLFRDPPGPLDVARTMFLGSSLKVVTEDKQTPLFEGEVTAVEYNFAEGNRREVYIRGYDALHRLRKRQSLRVLKNFDSLKLLAQFLIADTAIQKVVIDEPRTTDQPKWTDWIQHRQHDLELLAEAAALLGLYFFVRGDTLYFMTLKGQGTPVELVLGESLQTARVELNADAVCDSVTVIGWDTKLASPVKATASRPRLGRTTKADVRAQAVGGSSQRFIVNESVTTTQQALYMAQAELDGRAATAVTFWGRAAGNPDLQPGVPIHIRDVDLQFDGRHILTEVTHQLDVHAGYKTELSTQVPAIKSQPRGDMATIGIVTKVNDPEELGRICVVLPAFGEVETEWLQVVMPGAGKQKGLVMLPDTGDLVLVILIRDNPTRSVVLGGLYGQQKVPDAGVHRNSVHQFSWRTAAGQQIELNEVGDVIRLQNEAGAFIELNGSDITISGKTVDFKQL